MFVDRLLRKIRLTALMLVALYSIGIQAGQEDIAYLRLSDGYWQVWLTDASGQEHRQITHSKYDKATVSWASSPSKLLISGNDGVVRLMDLASGEELAIGETSLVYDAEHYSKGNKVVFTRPTSAQLDNNSLWVMELPSKTQTRISTFPGLHQSPSWAADGSIVFSVRKHNDFLHLWYYKKDAEGKKILKQLSFDQTDSFDPSVSAKSWLAYTKSLNGNYDIFVRKGLESKEYRLTSQPGFDGEPVWGPESKMLAYHSSGAAGAGIWLVSVNGNLPPTRITPDNVSARSPSWRH